MRVTASIQTLDGKVINEAPPFERESDGTIPTVIKVPLVVGRFRRRRLKIVVRIEP